MIYKISARTIRYGILLAYKYIDKGLVMNSQDAQKMRELVAKRYGPKSLVTKAFSRKVVQHSVRLDIERIVQNMELNND